MNTHEQFAALWTDYLEGDLDEAGMVELRELIAADDSLLQLAADMYQTHHLLGLVVDKGTARQDLFVCEAMSRLPEDSGSFVDRVMGDISIAARTSRSTSDTASVTGRSDRDTMRGGRRVLSRGQLSAAALAIVAIIGLAIWISPRRSAQPLDIANREQPPSEIGPSHGDAVAPIEARFASLAHARFFGELLPPVDSVLTPRRDYVLMSGFVEVAFPAGASAILEGPAVFRVLSNECLALDIGRCSVHAPDGAEGFRVETPVTRVVDRGTRFAVSVSETSETEVQVIEGAADVYQQPDHSVSRTPVKDDAGVEFQVRLKTNQAQTFTNIGKFSADSMPFNSDAYHQGLPDRVISYDVTRDDTGGAIDLTSVRVQRGGTVMDLAVEELIPVEVTSFTGHSGHALIASNGALPEPRRLTSSDFSLQTGLINPDGSREPLTTDPITSVPDSSEASLTPGMAIRFQSPVVNGPGPDVIFFELQSIGYPPEGDAFHVSPLQFRDGLRSHTIQVYDLTLESPEALRVATFHIHMFKGPVDSLEDLETREHASRHGGSKFRGLAVGIDLSDLGYANGERVEGLFIQDAMDDQHNVDPVFIAGLPSISEVQDR